MEIIKIGSSALKISLCTTEAEKYNIRETEKEESLKKSFIKLLLEARNRVEFEVKGNKIIAEMFSCKDGNCEIFISQVEDNESVYKEKTPQEISRRQRLQNAYMLDSINGTIAISKRLHSIGYKGSSSLYFDETERNYYIFLDDVSIKELKYSFLSEYAQPVRNSRHPMIKEYFHCVFKRNAVRTLAGI